MIPFVSRGTFELLIAERDRLARDLVAERVRYDELLLAYRQLRMQGASEPVSVPIAPRDEPDPIDQAILTFVPADARQSAYMQVEIDKANGHSRAEIVDRIRGGFAAPDAIR